MYWWTVIYRFHGKFWYFWIKGKSTDVLSCWSDLCYLWCNFFYGPNRMRKTSLIVEENLSNYCLYKSKHIYVNWLSHLSHLMIYLTKNVLMMIINNTPSLISDFFYYLFTVDIHGNKIGGRNTKKITSAWNFTEVFKKWLLWCLWYEYPPFEKGGHCYGTNYTTSPNRTSCIHKYPSISWIV